MPEFAKNNACLDKTKLAEQGFVLSQQNNVQDQEYEFSLKETQRH